SCSPFLFFFFFQAEDGIRDFHVTGVQTCALPISLATRPDIVGVQAAADLSGLQDRMPPFDPKLVPAILDEALGSRAAQLTEISRSEEHTSELQSRENLVCRLLLEKKKRTQP